MMSWRNLVVPAAGSRPRCTMVVVPPGISSGTARTSECAGKALRVPVPKTSVHPCVLDRSTLSWLLNSPELFLVFTDLNGRIFGK